MKYRFSVLVILASLILLLSMSLVSATVGIGLKWFTESEYAPSGGTKCINYGLYNPYDRDIQGYLTATNELEPFYEAEKPKLIPKMTSSTNAISTKICFKIPKIYPESCILGMMCERKCQGAQGTEETRYKGEVVGAYKLETAGGMGSATGSSFAAPLTLIVRCEEKQRNWLPAILILIVIIGAIVAWWLFKKKRQKF